MKTKKALKIFVDSSFAEEIESPIEDNPVCVEVLTAVVDPVVETLEAELVGGTDIKTLSLERLIFKNLNYHIMTQEIHQ